MQTILWIYKLVHYFVKFSLMTASNYEYVRDTDNLSAYLDNLLTDIDYLSTDV